jgi:hypothetical protein
MDVSEALGGKMVTYITKQRMPTVETFFLM